MASSVWRAALHGLGYGAAGAAILFLLRDRYTLSKDWFLAAMIVAATSSAFALGAWYRVRLLVVALAGLAGVLRKVGRDPFDGLAYLISFWHHIGHNKVLL